MILMKSCRPEHHILTAKNLRLGTLEYYRNHLDPEIADFGESALSTRLIIDRKTEIPTATLNRIWPGGIQFGERSSRALLRNYNLYIKHMTLPEVNLLTALVRNLDVTYTTAKSDALIFCMTMTDDINAPAIIGYSSNWKMHEQSVGALANHIESELNLHLRDTPKTFSTRNPKAGNLHFKVTSAKVQYRCRVLEIKNPDPHELRKLGSDLENSDFIKETPYCHQKEYRFCARLMHGDVVAALNPDLEYFEISPGDIKNHALA